MSGVRTVGILQARMSSSRLPGKVLMELGGKPLLGFMVDRVRRSRLIDELVLATSTDPSDDPLAEAASAMALRVVRGPLDDVLARFVQAAEEYQADVVVRLTGDCPLIDPEVIDRVVAQVIDGNCSYASNTMPPSYPDGLDCEAFTAALLKQAHREAHLPSQREHVTPWIRENADGPVGTVSCAADLSDLRWTIDYPDDLDLVRAMVANLGAKALTADLFDMLRAYDRVGGRQKSHARNEGYAKSLADDRR